MGFVLDLTGQRFGRLVVERYLGGSNGRHWEARCDCGAMRDVDSSNLKRNLTQSCGCLWLERAKLSATTHGLTRTIEHRAWSAAKNRCSNPRNSAFPDYGGRGIVMADVWRNDFPAFLRDMGPRPKGLTLDRIDNNGPYSPENCRWATRGQQMRNTRHNKRLTFQGETLTMAEWSRRFGWPNGVIVSRRLRGWPVERILSEPRRIWPSQTQAVPEGAHRAHG